MIHDTDMRKIYIFREGRYLSVALVVQRPYEDAVTVTLSWDRPEGLYWGYPRLSYQETSLDSLPTLILALNIVLQFVDAGSNPKQTFWDLCLGVQPKVVVIDSPDEDKTYQIWHEVPLSIFDLEVQ